MPQDNPATGPATGDQTILCIGEFRLDLHLRSLNREGEKVKITPRPLATLEYLVRNRHRVVSKAELLDKVWGGQREISAVEHVIGQLRRALGENADEVRYIETVPGQGYRLIAEVRAAGVIDAAPAIPDNEVAGASATPPVRSPVSRRPRLALIALGFVAVLGVSFGVRALAPHLGRPVVRRTLINGKTLTAIGDTGGVLWTRELDLPWKERNPGEDEPTWRNQIVDLGRDGSPDVLVAAPTAPDEDQLLCFSPRGNVLWRYRAPIQARFGAWDVAGPWIFRQMLAPSDSGSRSIYLSVIHPIWWPSFVVRISPSGKPEVVFANSGHIRVIRTITMASGNYLLAAGTNNEYTQAFLAILRQDGPPATSPQGDALEFLCTRGCPPGRPYRYILFPRTELSTASDVPYNFAVGIRARTDGLTVETDELWVGTAPRAFYDFSPELLPRSVSYGDGYRELHGKFERGGRIKHGFDQCPERKTPAILRICDENGNWSAVSVPHVP